MTLTAALRTGDLAELPSRRDEDWRWTDLRGLIRVLPAPSPRVDAVGANAALSALGAALVIANGRVLTEAGAASGLQIRRFVSAGEGGAHLAETMLSVAAGQSLTLIDSFEGQTSGYLSDAATPIRVEAGATLERIVLLDDAADAVSITLTEVDLAPGASFRQTVLASGAKRQRFETRVRHHGGGASVRLDGVYVLGDARHSDQTSEVDHLAVDGATSQLTKGVVQGRSRGVFQGRIVVEPGADRTDARMGHHALILSEQAEVDAKPELLIHADDVACAHGNTVGALDEAALFYARSRGIPEAEARAMLIEAFLGEVIDRIEHDGARDLARAWVADKLRGLG